MTQVWSDEAKLARMLEVELAALEGWSALGVVPGDAMARIRSGAHPPSAARVAELERENEKLQGKLETAGLRAKAMLDRVRFLRQQSQGGER